MKLSAPTVGPIIGYTAPDQTRIWFRGQFEGTGESSYRRCFGVLRYRKRGLRKWSAPLFNKMSPNFDMSCVVALTDTVGFDVKPVGGIKSMIFGGEGVFLATLSGPGKVWLQSLPFSRMAGRMLAAAPQGGGKNVGECSVLGGLGKILDGDNRF